jgi:hypothetical protein
VQILKKLIKNSFYKGSGALVPYKTPLRVVFYTRAPNQSLYNSFFNVLFWTSTRISTAFQPWQTFDLVRRVHRGSDFNKTNRKHCLGPVLFLLEQGHLLQYYLRISSKNLPNDLSLARIILCRWEDRYFAHILFP